MQVGSFTMLPSATITRPADTTAYASGDLVANSTTAGSVTPFVYSIDTGNQPHRFSAGGKGSIRAATLITSNVSLTNGSFRAHFFSRRPPPSPAVTLGSTTPSPIVANGDNAAFSTDDVTYYLGAIDITMLQAFTDGAWGKGVPNVGTDLHFDLNGGCALYGLLEARAAYTPTSAGTFTLSPHIVQA